MKFGVQSKRNIRVQGYIKIEDLEDEIPLLSSNGKIYGIGGDVLIAFPLSQRFRPYALVGLSSDFAELNDPGIEYSEDFLNAISLKAGVGGLFRINDMLEFQVGYDIQYRTWQEIEVVEPFFGDVDVEQDDQSSSFHVGLNIFF